MKNAKGDNPNPFFEIPKIKKPIISAEAKLNELALKPTFLYDFDTEAGKTYTLIIKK